MGYAKDLRIQEDEQGWRSSPDTDICARCVSDDELATYVGEHATGHTCSFCDRTSKKNPSTIPLDELMEIIGNVVRQYYDEAVNKLGWEDGQYIGRTYDAYDIVGDFDITEDDDARNAIIQALNSGPWCDKHPYSTTGLAAYQLSWEQFCTTVKHGTRYFFNRRDDGIGHETDLTPTAYVLDEISGMLGEHGLITTVPASTDVVRVRVHQPGEKCANWQSLGPPPPERAPSNRMSPAGISMFYASTTTTTAKAEALASLPTRATVALTAATWALTRDAQILDLTNLPAIPSFWFAPRYDRDQVRFLHDFAKSITQPVVHDGREHIEYVPTQILTEYLRHEYRIGQGQRLDGVLYPSAQAKNGKNIVLFANQKDLTPRDEQDFRDHTPLLQLNQRSIKRLRLRKR